MIDLPFYQSIYSFCLYQVTDTPASGSLKKVLITVSTRKLMIQDMLTKVF